MYKHLIQQVPLFKNLEEGAITQICGLIKPFTAMKSDLIFQRGEVGREMYIIIEGEVSLHFTAKSAEMKRADRMLGSGDIFGEGCMAELFYEPDQAEEECVPTIAQQHRPHLQSVNPTVVLF